MSTPTTTKKSRDVPPRVLLVVYSSLVTLLTVVALLIGAAQGRVRNPTAPTVPNVTASASASPSPTTS